MCRTGHHGRQPPSVAFVTNEAFNSYLTRFPAFSFPRSQVALGNALVRAVALPLYITWERACPGSCTASFTTTDRNAASASLLAAIRTPMNIANAPAGRPAHASPDYYVHTLIFAPSFHHSR